ncbi:hypothetical protein Shyhy01_26500 [Streptomyces hygroscopicus subsp. hygroscopicus]|nr:hypothetical protein [Streptomyces hygroscopicus]GLX49700.1 hypothetical protein Shyhy01_26500 [Streptomyces hygroscopicus subsp. hygroscopicus]
MEPGALEAEPVLAASAVAFTALQAVGQALPEYRSSALGRLGRTEEAEAEERRAYKTGQGRRWYRHNPNGADAVAAVAKAADAAQSAAVVNEHPESDDHHGRLTYRAAGHGGLRTLGALSHPGDRRGKPGSRQ